MNEKPTPPEDWECCGSGCSPCVWDHYYEELETWNQATQASPADSDTRNSATS